GPGGSRPASRGNRGSRLRGGGGDQDVGFASRPDAADALNVRTTRTWDDRVICSETPSSEPEQCRIQPGHEGCPARGSPRETRSCADRSPCSPPRCCCSRAPPRG